MMFFDCPKIKPQQSKIILIIPYTLVKLSGDFPAFTGGGGGGGGGGGIKKLRIG